jgi:TatD DNase family protein
LFIDSHAHLYYKKLLDQLDDVIGRASDAGVNRIICVGTNLESSKTSISISERYPSVFATVGIHPHDAKDAPVNYMEEIARLANHPRVIAVGEMGLDFYRNLSPQETQREVFQNQLELAQSLGLPAVIHNRNADNTIYEVIKSVGYEKGVMHCFSSDVTMAQQVLNFGFKISFTGTVTYGKHHNEIVLKEVPLESIMLETDCPFLSPVPKRGKLNEPANIPLIAGKIAEIKKESVETVAKITTNTAINFFNLPA